MYKACATWNMYSLKIMDMTSIYVKIAIGHENISNMRCAPDINKRGQRA